MRKQPIFLNLFKIHLPITGLVSILHRVSGVYNILLFPFLIYLYWLLPQGQMVDFYVTTLPIQLLLWLAISAFFYHFIAGVRHMYVDFVHVHTLGFARASAYLVLVLSIIMSAWAGWVIWFS